VRSAQIRARGVETLVSQPRSKWPTERKGRELLLPGVPGENVGEGG